MCRDEKDYLWQFLPRDFVYLTEQKTQIYKNYTLKNDYLINIMHELILKFFFNNELNHNLWSTILRKKYGKTYNIYIDYLLEKGFMNLISNYYVGKKAKTYKLNITILDVIKHKVTDKVLLKKHSKDYLLRTFTSEQESPINLSLRKKLIDDLYHVEIDYEAAYKWLNERKNDKTLELEKYFRNVGAIDGINSGYIFFKFDSYGRLHTNFTVLKKHIRKNFLTIDGQEIEEIDIKNSQPFFFAVAIKNEHGEDTFDDEMRRYVDSVKNGLIYDEILQKFPDKIKTRDQAKVMMYKVLFGNNGDRSNEETRLFKKLYPGVCEYIKDFKYFSNSYKELSHKLQLLESEFIFNKVVTEIKQKFPQIKLFTVHDSICFPVKYKEEVNIIFRKHLDSLL